MEVVVWSQRRKSTSGEKTMVLVPSAPTRPQGNLIRSLRVSRTGLGVIAIAVGGNVGKALGRRVHS